MNPERRSVESHLTNTLRLTAISLPVAERQGYRQGTTASSSRTRSIWESRESLHPA